MSVRTRVAQAPWRQGCRECLGQHQGSSSAAMPGTRLMVGRVAGGHSSFCWASRLGFCCFLGLSCRGYPLPREPPLKSRMGFPVYAEGPLDSHCSDSYSAANWS